MSRSKKHHAARGFKQVFLLIGLPLCVLRKPAFVEGDSGVVFGERSE